MGYYQYPLNLECRFPRGAILAEAAATDQAAKAQATALESCPSITVVEPSPAPMPRLSHDGPPLKLRISTSCQSSPMTSVESGDCHQQRTIQSPGETPPSGCCQQGLQHRRCDPSFCCQQPPPKSSVLPIVPPWGQLGRQRRKRIKPKTYTGSSSAQTLPGIHNETNKSNLNIKH